MRAEEFGYSSSLPTDGARAGLLDDAIGRRTELASFSAASAASIHSEYISMGSVKSACTVLEGQRGSGNERTVGFALVFLVTYFAQQLRNPLLSVDTHRHGFVVMTEEAGESRLYKTVSAHAQLREGVEGDIPSGSFRRGPVGLREDFLRLPIAVDGRKEEGRRALKLALQCDTCCEQRRHSCLEICSHGAITWSARRARVEFLEFYCPRPPSAHSLVLPSPWPLAALRRAYARTLRLPCHHLPQHAHDPYLRNRTLRNEPRLFPTMQTPALPKLHGVVPLSKGLRTQMLGLTSKW